MSKITITNIRPGGFGIPGGPVIAGNNGSLEAEQKDWDGVKDHPVVKAWLDAGHLKVSGAKAEKQEAGNGGGGDESKTAEQVLALQGGQFMTFKSEATKLLGEKTPATKAEIILALEELATQP